MPGLLRGVARTAAIAGTATAVSGRVQRRQAQKFAEQDQTIAANQGAGYHQGYEQAATQAPAGYQQPA
ncbi:MAG: SHOCT domain-containing protein, partial [Candidatus Nanopelagicales bacterium]